MNRFKDPSLLFRKLSWSGTCINQWPPSKTMSCQKKIDRYIFKAPKFEIGHILAVQNQDLRLCAPRYPTNKRNPCIERLVFWSSTYLILWGKFPGGWCKCHCNTTYSLLQTDNYHHCKALFTKQPFGHSILGFPEYQINDDTKPAEDSPNPRGYPLPKVRHHVAAMSSPIDYAMTSVFFCSDDPGTGNGPKTCEHLQ